MRIKALVVAIAGIVGLTAVQACGPEFQIMLTTCDRACRDQIRAPALRELLAAVIEAVPEPLSRPADSGLSAAELEADGVSDDVKQQFIRMRAASDGDEAYSLGEGLPIATRLYTAGAVDFLHAHTPIPWNEGGYTPYSPEPEGDLASDAQAQAAKAAVVKARKAQRLDAAIARFEHILTLPHQDAAARLLWAEYMLGRAYRLRANPDDQDLARQHFERVVVLVDAGAQDPLDLRQGALGELGALALARGQIPTATEFYARQASAPGARHGVDSLIAVARRIYHDRNSDLDRAVSHPLTQRLLISFALSGVAATCDTSYCSEANPDSGDALGRLLTALRKLSPDQVQLPDRVAALAYETGDYAYAERIVAASTNGFGDWMRAKLALHRGDLQAAAQFYARAASHFPAAPDTVEPPRLAQRLNAEGSAVRLARGEYIEALHQLLHSAPTFDLDASYIAERVLTVKELRNYVDHQPEATRLRDLLARRMAREGQYAAAIPYYAKDKVRGWARQYRQQRERAEHTANAIERAQAWYRTAQLEITRGMELSGTTLAPDYAIYSGNFPGGFQSFGGGETDNIPSDLASPDERARHTASATKPARRFHYRAVAVDHLLLAADLLPPDSPTVGALLCQGAQWLRHRREPADGELVTRLYHRYRQAGRSNPWDRNFGAECPQPAF